MYITYFFTIGFTNFIYETLWARKKKGWMEQRCDDWGELSCPSADVDKSKKEGKALWLSGCLEHPSLVLKEPGSNTDCARQFKKELPLFTEQYPVFFRWLWGRVMAPPHLSYTAGYKPLPKWPLAMKTNENEWKLGTKEP